MNNEKNMGRENVLKAINTFTKRLGTDEECSHNESWEQGLYFWLIPSYQRTEVFLVELQLVITSLYIFCKVVNMYSTNPDVSVGVLHLIERSKSLLKWWCYYLHPLFNANFYEAYSTLQRVLFFHFLNCLLQKVFYAFIMLMTHHKRSKSNCTTFYSWYL